MASKLLIYIYLITYFLFSIFTKQTKPLNMKNFIITTFLLLIPVILIAQDAPEPMEEYIEGRLVKTLDIENVEVSTSLRSIQRSDGKYYTFDIAVINKSALVKNLKVNNFKAFITQIGKKKNKKEELDILSNKEYQEKKRKRAALRTALAAMGAAANAQDAGRKTSTTNTNVNSSTYGSATTNTDANVYASDGSWATGSASSNTDFNAYTNVNASSTTQSYDGAAAYAARQNEERKLQEMVQRQNEAKAKWNDMYLKNETLDAMESVSGLINVKFKKGDLIDLILYVGNVEFIFKWDPEDSEF